MKTWIIMLVAAMLVIVVAGVGIMGSVNAAQSDSDASVSAVNDAPSCSSCGNSCTADSNCGRASCGAVSGSGSCGCNG